MDWRMLWKDLAAGFLIAGLLSALIPDGVWRAIFLSHLSPGWRALAEALIGPLVAMLTFVCSIGNVPLAATLWGGGVGFVGVLAFLYADLIVLPLIDTYRRSFGWRMALAITAALYLSMAAAALIVGGGFELAGAIPVRQPAAGLAAAVFRPDYTAVLNMVALLLTIWLFWTARAGSHHHHHPH